MPENELLSYRKNEEGVALLIDWENLKIGLLENHKASPDIDLLLEAVDKYGQRGASKAYANWQHHSHLHDDQSRLLMRSVETVQILGRNPNSGRVIKNSADVAMAVEAIRLCYTQPDLTTFVLVTGDGDLIHLVNELKRNRNKVVIIGVGTSVSKVLGEAADEVLFYERDITKEKSSKDISSKLEASTVYNWVEAILRDYQGHDMSLPALGQQLWRKHNFTAKQLNMSLSSLAEEMAKVGRIDLTNEKVSIAKSVAEVSPQNSGDASSQMGNKPFWQSLHEHKANKDVLKVKVSHVLDTGLQGKLEGFDVEAFLPNNQLGLKRSEDPAMYVGQVLDAQIIQVDSTKELVVLSHSKVKAQALAKARQKMLASLRVGDVVKATVINLTDFGAFVDLGGLDGLIHKSELSHTRIKHPQELVSIDDEIEAKIISIDSYKGRISLSIKRLQSDPWHELVKSYPVGTKVKGKVTNLESYGAFVELEEGLSALIHISELGQKVRHPSEILQLDQEIDAEVIVVNEAKKRLSLRLEQTTLVEDNPDLVKDRNLPAQANELLKANTAKQQILVFEAKEPSKSVSKDGNIKAKDPFWKDSESEAALLANISEDGEAIDESLEVNGKVASPINNGHDESAAKVLRESLQNSSQEMRWLINFLSQKSEPSSLSEVFESLNEEYGLKQPAFKASIKKAHKDGWIKLIRHKENKGLYTTLTEKVKLESWL